MFDVGFSELCMVALVSLLVIGPEKLPQVARVLGFWLGKLRSMAANMQAEIKAELHAEEMQRMLQEQEELYKRFELERAAIENSILQDPPSLHAEALPLAEQRAQQQPVDFNQP